MIKLLDPKNDVVFQKIFGAKKHKEILISFLNSLLYLKGKDEIKEVTFEEKTLDVSLMANEKISILDLHVVTENNVNINVEIQLINQYNMIKRTIFYMSKMILGQLKRGEDYSLLNRTITINILNFDYLEEEHFIKNFGLFEKKSKKYFTDIIEIIFIELPKFNKAHKNYNDKLHKWLMFLANPGGKEIEELVKSDGEIKEAMDILYEISGDKESIMLANMREKALMDEQSRLKGAKEEGIQEGIKEGSNEKAILIAKKMLKKGKSIEEVSELTELSIEEVKKLAVK